MVADTLEVGYGVEIEHTRFGVALLAVEAEYMRILAFEGQVVDMLLKVGEFLCLVVAERLVIKRRHRTLKQCNDTAAELVELLPRGVGELEPLADIVLSRFGEVYRMVADALDIVYRVENAGDIIRIAVGYIKSVELDEIRGYMMVEVVYDLFVFHDLVEIFVATVYKRVGACLKVIARELRHAGDLLADLHDSEGRRIEQTVVDKLAVHLALAVVLAGNEQAGELDESFREREHNNGRDDIEYDMRYGYLRHRVGRQFLYPLDIGSEQGDKNEYARADKIEEQVDNCGALRVFLRTDSREECREAGSDILTEEDKNGKLERHESLHGESLEHADGSRGALEYGGHDYAEDNTKQRAQRRLRDGDDKVHEACALSERSHGIGHHIDAEEEQTEACEYCAEVLDNGLFRREHEYNADKHRRRRYARKVQRDEQ